MNTASGVVAVVLVCVATLGVGAFGLRVSRTMSDFYVAWRAVTPYLNASAISGEYLSAASFLGAAGLISPGCRHAVVPRGLHRRLPRAARLRRRAAAPVGRLHARPTSPRPASRARAMRRLSRVLVVAIGLLYLIPQLQGAGLTLRTVTGAPTWVGRGRRGRRGRASTCCRAACAVDHAHPGLPVLAQARRDRRPRLRPDVGLAGRGGAGASHRAQSGWAEPLDGRCGARTPGLPHLLASCSHLLRHDGPAPRRSSGSTPTATGGPPAARRSSCSSCSPASTCFPPSTACSGGSTASTSWRGPRPTRSCSRCRPCVRRRARARGSRRSAGGAFAAFLSTSTGLDVSVAGVLGQDLLRRRRGRLRRGIRGQGSGSRRCSP